jgi:mannose-6-phosphate isomerase-like protein (cupin superfamily)
VTDQTKTGAASAKLISKAEAFARMPKMQKERSVALFEHGSLVTKLYAPREIDLQTPHSRDEIYVIIKGTGEFVCNSQRWKFAPGDFIFVPARAEHCFENFSDDFSVWFFSTDRKAAKRIRPSEI